MQTKIYLEVWNGGEFGDNPECKCGNATHLDGFYPSDLTGEQVEPDDRSPWHNGIYVCGRCELVGIVINDREFRRNGCYSRSE